MKARGYLLALAPVLFILTSAAAADVARSDPATIARGKEIADERRCKRCHLPTYEGHDQVPRLAGQRRERLLAEMKAFRDRRRPGGETMMAEALDGLGDADIAALAAFLASLPP